MSEWMRLELLHPTHPSRINLTSAHLPSGLVTDAFLNLWLIDWAFWRLNAIGRRGGSREISPPSGKPIEPFKGARAGGCRNVSFMMMAPWLSLGCGVLLWPAVSLGVEVDQGASLEPSPFQKSSRMEYGTDTKSFRLAGESTFSSWSVS